MYAGSALKQGVGKLSEWDQWKPTSELSYRWLLLAGATDPPKEVSVSSRRSREARSGDFLEGVKHDLKNIEVGLEILKNDNKCKHCIH